MDPNFQTSRNVKNWLIPAGIAVLSLVVFAVWLALTPPGLIGKLQAVAYSVCHENPDHSLIIGGNFLPLCARCTGMFLGCLVGLGCLSVFTRGAANPARRIRWALWALVLFFAVDGLNSAAHSLFDEISLYPPSNVLRLVSGLGMGLVLAAVLLSLWRQTIKQQPEDEPGMASLLQLSAVTLAEGLLAIFILFAPGWLFLPVAILSVLAVPFMLAMVYTLLWVLIRKREDSIRNSSQRITYMLLGCLTAFTQIGVFDLIRFTLTGSWVGIRF